MLTVWAVVLCWEDVSWALRPGLFPILDELSTRAEFARISYGPFLHILPNTFYADRPIGWIFIGLMGDLFGFSYAKQVACLIAIHFGNCGFAFLLFRRLGASTPISIAAVALFGSLATTMITVTYLGESFDVICLFFLLSSTLALVYEARGSTFLSAVLFLAALRSKEFAIVTPFLFTVLVALRMPTTSAWGGLGSAMRRLWMHYVILLAFSLRYLSLRSSYVADHASGNPYFMEVRLGTVLRSLSYYTALIFAAEGSHWQLAPIGIAMGLGIILCWAVLRRRAGVAFGICAYVLTLLPVCMLPNTRAPFWVYAPQLFLILAFGLLAEDALASLVRPRGLRWGAGACIALVCLSCCVVFRRGSYFKDRVRWDLSVRRTSTRTAHDVTAQLPHMRAGTHIYVNHSRDTIPWLFVAGPCSYFSLINHQYPIQCVLDQPSDKLRQLYASDAAAKFFLNYNDDGSVSVAESAESADRNK